MADQRRPDLRAAAGDDIDYTFGQAALEQDLAQCKGRARGQLAWLDDRGAASGKREGQLLTDDQEGEVPGRDQGDDAHRLVNDHGQHVLAEAAPGLTVQIAA